MLEVGAPAAANQQAVAGEGHAFIVHHVGDASLGVTRRGANLQVAAAELDAVAVREIAVGSGSAARRTEGDRAAAALLEKPRPGDVIGVHVRVERRNEFDVELLDQRGVALRLLEDRVDQDRLAAAAIGQQIRVRRRLRIEKLAEDQHLFARAAGGRLQAGSRARLHASRSIRTTSIPATIAATNTIAFR